MVQDISLDHLQEEEVELILKVLERDAKIQKQEDARRKRLQNSIRGERIPEKRLSVKIRTGEWMTEMTAPSRALKRRATEIVRASIRRKGPPKPKPPEHTEEIVDSHEAEKQADTESKQEENTTISEAESKEDQSEPDKVPDTAQHISHDHEDANSKIGIETQNTSPFRKTSIRRKKKSTSGDKQVKFDTGKTKKFIYDQTKVESIENLTFDPEAPQSIPKIVVQEPAQEKAEETKEYESNVEVTVIDEPGSEDNKVKETDVSFESYHNSYGKQMYEEKTQEQADSAAPKSEKEKVDEPPKAVKKIRVIKRKGSSRRKGGKITDDSSRNSLFSKPDEEKDDEAEKAKIATELAESVVASVTEQQEMVQNGGISDFGSADPIHQANSAIDTHPDHEMESASTDIAVVKDDELESSLSSLIGEIDKQYETLREKDKVTQGQEGGYGEVEHKSGVENFEESQGHTYTQGHTYIQGHTYGQQGGSDEVEQKSDVENFDAGQGGTYIQGHENVTYGIGADRDTDDYGYSPKPDLDLGLSDILNTIPEKYDPGPTEIHKPETLHEADLTPKSGVSNLGENSEAAESPNPFADYSVDVAQEATYNTAKEAEMESTASHHAPNEAEEDLTAAYHAPKEIEELTVADIAPKEAEFSDEGAHDLPKIEEEKSEELVNKPKKKVIKKIVKKKKPEKSEGEEQGSPKSEPAHDNNEENAEGSPKNLSRLHRGKTVRKKVIRKAPPPAE